LAAGESTAGAAFRPLVASARPTTAAWPPRSARAWRPLTAPLFGARRAIPSRGGRLLRGWSHRRGSPDGQRTTAPKTGATD